MLMIGIESIHWIFSSTQCLVGCVAVFLMPPELVVVRAGLLSATAARITLLAIRSQAWFTLQGKEVNALQTGFHLMLMTTLSMSSSCPGLLPVLSICYWYLCFYVSVAGLQITLICRPCLPFLLGFRMNRLSLKGKKKDI